MIGYTEKIRKRARELLAEGKVDAFVGYRLGSVPLMNQPVMIKRPEDTEQLVWDSNCCLNLANYLTKRQERIGIVANGCNSRNIVIHITENQIKREQLYILGIPCEGTLDHRAILRAMGEKELISYAEQGDSFTVKANGLEKTFKKTDFLRTNCRTCQHKNPVIYDELLGELVPENTNVDPYSDVRAIENQSSEKKWEFFRNLISKCLRCYACRNACPLCYCPTCFVDESKPQWVGKSIDPTDTMTFHILRAFHCAGRCTDCGACERVCPVAIPMRQFTKKLNKDAKELFNWEPGLSLDQRPLFDFYKPEDYNDFVY